MESNLLFVKFAQLYLTWELDRKIQEQSENFTNQPIKKVNFFVESDVHISVTWAGVKVAHVQLHSYCGDLLWMVVFVSLIQCYQHLLSHTHT